MNTGRLHRGLVPISRQGGYATLATALIILISLTSVTIYAAKVGMIEQRTSANEFRAEEAFAAAEAGVEQGIAYLSRNRRQINSSASDGWMNSSNSIKWNPCDSTDITIPCGDGTNNLYGNTWLAIKNLPTAGTTVQPTTGSYALHYLTPSVAGAPGNGPVVIIVAEGTSADGTGKATVKQSVYFYPFVLNTPDEPLMAAGTIGGGGTFDVVTNPNGGGQGVPLSAWSKQNTSLGGSAKTCYLSEFLSTDSTHTTQTDGAGNTITLCPSCTCPATNSLSSAGTEGIDILDVDGNVGTNPDTTDFPADVFQYIFGAPESDWQSIKDQASVLPDCSSLNSNSFGLYWITGNCHPGSNVGSYANPVLLVVEGDTTANANLQIFGIIFAFSANPVVTMNVKLNGGPTLYGAVVSNRNIDMGNGTYKMRFDEAVLKNIGVDAAGRGLGKIPGGWSDY